MDNTTRFPKTFLNHPNQWRFKELLDKLFENPNPDHIAEAVVSFFKAHTLPIDDFPVLNNTYSRTILARHPNGFEAMAGRWQKNAVSSIHGHPRYAFMMTLHGRLQEDRYEQQQRGLKMTSSRILSPGEFISAIGKKNTFNNHIHGVTAIEETLSIHISSQDAAKGETFS